MIHLHYEYVDCKKQATLILLHGFLNDHHSMKGVAAAQQEYANIIYVDLPGFGLTQSQGIQYSMEDIVESLKEIALRCQDTNVYMLGYSMGGRVALAFACTYPELLEGLILESTSPGIKEDKERKDRLNLDTKRASEIMADYEKFITDWENMKLFSTQKNIEHSTQIEQRTERLLQAPAEVSDSLIKYGTGVQPSYWHVLNHLKLPVLQFAGSFDAKFIDINKKMNYLFQNASLKIIDGAGHNIHLEESQKFDIIVSAFINKEDINE